MAELDMVGLTVKDMKKSVEFYRLLGMNVPDVPEGEDYVDVITPAGYRVSWNNLDMVKKEDPNWVEPVGQRIGLGFKCYSPADVDALYKKVIDAGYQGHMEPWDAFWGYRYAVVKDPDGNNVDLFAALQNQES